MIISLKKKKAFSLFELAIVAVIIGLIIAGISQAGKMVTKSKIAAARSLTKISPVKDIGGLYLWYETSLESSFLKDEQVEESLISTWKDISGQKVNPKNATQVLNSSKPKIYYNIFNKALPAIRFDGTDDVLLFDGSALVETSYTIFVVEQRRSNDPINPIFGGSVNSPTGANLIFSYVRENISDADAKAITLGHYNGEDDETKYIVGEYDEPVARIHSMVFSQSSKKSYWLNGGSSADSTQTTNSDPVSGYTGSAIGRAVIASSTYYLDGDIAELIFFNRALNTKERRDVEFYLSKKYGIDLS